MTLFLNKFFVATKKCQEKVIEKKVSKTTLNANQVHFYQHSPEFNSGNL